MSGGDPDSANKHKWKTLTVVNIILVYLIPGKIPGLYKITIKIFSTHGDFNICKTKREKRNNWSWWGRISKRVEKQTKTSDGGQEFGQRETLSQQAIYRENNLLSRQLTL